MGFKRPFDDDKFHELPLKHSRQLGYGDKSTQFEEIVPCHAISQKSFATVNKGDPCNPQEGESFDDETLDEESSFVYPGLNVDGSFDWVTKGYNEKDVTHSLHSAKSFEIGVPQRILDPMETLYSFILDQPVRKQVPIGPGHQATIPEWEGSIGCDDCEKLSGTSVVPMPALNMPANMDDIVGKGREFCVCRDTGSIRCVRQHIKEARDKMVKILGYQKFKHLGFCDMGEEVVQNWSDEDALLFHEIVYSNPMALGQNFWQHLEAAFCFGTKNEIVSYYFNVFVLRRRATQNRTLLLDIDSDDDEWHRGYEGFLDTQYVEEDEEDCTIKSLFRQGAIKSNEKVHPLHPEEGEEDASISYNGEDDNLDEGGTGLCDEHKKNTTVVYMDRFSGSNDEILNVKDDSCATFEDSHGWTNFAKKDETGLGVSANGKVLQPTGSVMDEIFGHESWENKARNN